MASGSDFLSAEIPNNYNLVSIRSSAVFVIKNNVKYLMYDSLMKTMLIIMMKHRRR